MNDQANTPAHQTNLIVSATFTAEPILRSIQFWIEQLRLPVAAQIAPFNQVFQQLLDPSSLLARNRNGMNVLLVRLQDWSHAASGAVDLAQLKGRTDEFVNTVIRTLSGDASAELVVVFCAASDLPDDKLTYIQRVEDEAASALNKHNGVQAISSRALSKTYPVEDYADAHGDRLASIPYTDVYFAALGTRVIRSVYGTICAPKKVIIVDCDDTLWSGLCGEVGPTGVQVESHHLMLQQLLRSQRRQGKLICLASRNNEADVLAVFRENPNMILTLDDIAHREIHWQAKSSSVQSISDQFQLATSTFIFIDDDPAQCSEVSHGHPDVMTVLAPQSTPDMKQMVQHLWPLDSGVVTQESSARTQSYRDHAKRESVRAASPTLQTFLQSLELEVTISSMTGSDIPRAYELTQRTTQFNLTGLKLTGAQLTVMMSDTAICCEIVRAKDRYGDYGIVGLMIHQIVENELRASVFLLSCRALGRSVEYQMFSHLARAAMQAGAASLVLTANRTARNAPALNFLTGLGEVSETNGETVILSLATADAVSINTTDAAAACSLSHEPAEPQATAQTPEQSDNDFQVRTRQLADMYQTMWQPSEIHQAMSNVSPQNGDDLQSDEPNDAVQQFLTDLFCELLGVGDFEGDVSFFELGGHSLQAVQVLARASSAYDIELDPTLLFTTNFTVDELCEEIDHLVASRGSIQGVSGLLEQISNLTD